MIFEYAIEPDLAVAWGRDRTEYRYFYEQFGLGTSRMMAEFPKIKNWRKQFKQAAANADETNELPRITAIYNLLKERVIRCDSLDYDGNLSWLENTESAGGSHKFHAILSRANPRHHDRVLLASGAEGTNPLWRVDKQAYCARQSADMAKLITPILVNCSEIHFIDPYFGPENRRYRKPIEAFLDVIDRGRTSRPVIDKIVIHTSNRADYDFFRNTCRDKLEPEVPAGISIILQRWKTRKGGEKFHNRYILTDIGGVKVDPGLDEGSKGENFEVILLERKLYEKQWGDYVSNPVFDLAGAPIEIIGTKDRMSSVKKCPKC